ncbi:ribosome-binding factor A [Candidatus Falkowbacteria bacterium]|jgi:ribosome-binding factor A|nr:ribosome-binding factor A [Candidatus Falkowbacteria bacterium]
MIPTNKRLNDLLRQKIAELVNQLVEFYDGLITIAYVDLSSNGQEAKVGVSVLPVNLYGTALRQLRKKSAEIAKKMAKSSRLARVPRIIWLIDDTTEQAAKLDKIFDQAV